MESSDVDLPGNRIFDQAWRGFALLFHQALNHFPGETFMQVTDAYRDSSNTNDPGGRLVQIVARINF